MLVGQDAVVRLDGPAVLGPVEQGGGFAGGDGPGRDLIVHRLNRPDAGVWADAAGRLALRGSASEWSGVASIKGRSSQSPGSACDDTTRLILHLYVETVRRVPQRSD